MKRHMRFRTAAALLAAAAASAVVIPATATIARGDDDNDQPTREELMSEIRELKRRLDAVEQSREKTDEVHETLHEVLADAEARSRLLRFGSDLDPAGYDKTFFIRSSDGSFSLQPGLQFQFRHVTSVREGTGHADDSDDVESGFEVRRLKLSLEGNAFSKNTNYYFQWATDRNGGGVVLDDAWIRYQYNENWAFKAGQYKDPVFHEELNPDKTLLTAERSMLNEVLGGGITGRVQGVSAIYGSTDNPLSVEAMFHDGDRSLNTNFQDSPAGLGRA